LRATGIELYRIITAEQHGRSLVASYVRNAVLTLPRAYCIIRNLIG